MEHQDILDVLREVQLWQHGCNQSHPIRREIHIYSRIGFYFSFCVSLWIIPALYSERQKYGINSLKIKQNFFQKNLWTGQF
jgi:hypothetical protein